MSRFKNSDFVHTGPEAPAGRYLRQFWQPMLRSVDIKPGWAKRVQIMNEYVTLYRGQSGEAHVVADRCPHRHTQLSIGSIEGDAIRCFYHGWKFNGDGTCIETPCESANFARKVWIRSYPTYEYLGLVFVYLSDGEAPPVPHFPELDEDTGHPLNVRAWTLPFNYFQRLENSLDEAHVHFAHKVSVDLTDELRDLPLDYDAKETSYGILRVGVRERDDANDSRYGHFFMPNCNLLVAPPSNEADIWAAHLTWRVPVTDELTMSYSVNRRPPFRKKDGAPEKTFQPADDIVDAVFAGRMRMSDIDPDHPQLFNIQDTVAMTGQGPIYDREDERLGQADIGIIMLRKIYERELDNLTGGRPLKQWTRPSEKMTLGFEPMDVTAS